MEIRKKRDLLFGLEKDVSEERLHGKKGFIVRRCNLTDKRRILFGECSRHAHMHVQTPTQLKTETHN